jgi:hypothetical protein
VWSVLKPFFYRLSSDGIFFLLIEVSDMYQCVSISPFVESRNDKAALFMRRENLFDS